jgi:plastocyanin
MRLFFACAALVALLGATSFLAAPASSNPSPVQIQIDNYTFKPATVTVPVGTIITWKNLDDDPHTVTANDGSFNSKGLAQGDTWSHQFSKPGVYAYHCTVHPFMQASVIVKESN